PCVWLKLAIQPRSLGHRAGLGCCSSATEAGSFILFVCPAQQNLSRSLGLNAQTHVPAQPASPIQDARFSHSYEDQERKGRIVPPPRQGAEARFREARLPRIGIPVSACQPARPTVKDSLPTAPTRFPRSSRLLKHADFQAVYKEGRKQFTGNLAAFYRERSDQSGPRIGFAVGKVLGGAVQRNRIRRRMRAAVGRRLSNLE